MKASKARLLSEAEARRREKPEKLATKKIQAVREEICEQVATPTLENHIVWLDEVFGCMKRADFKANRRNLKSSGIQSSIEEKWWTGMA